MCWLVALLADKRDCVGFGDATSCHIDADAVSNQTADSKARDTKQK
jgi:hypothetical protein